MTTVEAAEELPFGRFSEDADFFDQAGFLSLTNTPKFHKIYRYISNKGA